MSTAVSVSPAEFERLVHGTGNRSRALVKLALERGVRVERTGNVWHFRAPWCDILAAGSPSVVLLHEIAPPRPGQHR